MYFILYVVSHILQSVVRKMKEVKDKLVGAH